MTQLYTAFFVLHFSDEHSHLIIGFVIKNESDFLKTFFNLLWETCRYQQSLCNLKLLINMIVQLARIKPIPPLAKNLVHPRVFKSEIGR